MFFLKFDLTFLLKRKRKAVEKVDEEVKTKVKKEWDKNYEVLVNAFKNDTELLLILVFNRTVAKAEYPAGRILSKNPRILRKKLKWRLLLRPQSLYFSGHQNISPNPDEAPSSYYVIKKIRYKILSCNCIA